MEQIIISKASKKDEKQLIKWFNHYNNKKIIKNRVECYINHNFTLIAKYEKKIIGVLQWLVKEDPKSGIAEFEEIFIKQDHRGKGIASMLVEMAINEVKKEFTKHGFTPRKIFLFVSKGTPAVKLYEKHGFKFIANLGKILSDSSDDLFYTLDL